MDREGGGGRELGLKFWPMIQRGAPVSDQTPGDGETTWMGGPRVGEGGRLKGGGAREQVSKVGGKSEGQIGWGGKGGVPARPWPRFWGPQPKKAAQM